MSASNLNRRERAKEYARRAKEVPCMDCGVEYPYYVMHFDHLSDKEHNINHYVKRGPSLNSLQREIDKCEVVCANCHAERTYQRMLAYPNKAEEQE